MSDATDEQQVTELPSNASGPDAAQGATHENNHTRALVSEIGSMKQAMFKKGANFVPLPQGMVFMNRLQFGFYSVLARLDVEVDYAAVERAFMAGVTDAA